MYCCIEAGGENYTSFATHYILYDNTSLANTGLALWCAFVCRKFTRESVIKFASKISLHKPHLEQIFLLKQSDSPGVPTKAEAVCNLFTRSYSGKRYNRETSGASSSNGVSSSSMPGACIGLGVQSLTLSHGSIDL